MKKITQTSIVISTVLPSIAFAESLGGTKELIESVRGMINTLTVIVAGLALLVFFWGLVKFIMKAGDEKAVEDGRRLMIWGVVALFVMTSVWGLVYFIHSELFPTTPVNAPAPVIPTFSR